MITQKKQLLTGYLFISLLLASFASSAQQAPQVTPRDFRPEAVDRPPPTLPQPAPAVIPDQAEMLFVQLTEVTIENGFPAQASASEALVAQVRGQRISVADFYKLAESIESLYRDGGFALVRVTVPPQSVKDGGSLRLVVVDGFIERIDVSALAERVRNRVQDILKPVVGRHQLRNNVLERTLTIAGRDPGLALNSALQAGTETGGVVLVLAGSQTLTRAVASVDNWLSDSLGPWQSNLQFTANQPLGFGEQLYINASSGANVNTAFRDSALRRVVGVGFILPLGRDGLSVNPEYTSSESKPLPQPYTPPTLSKFERYTLRFTYPLILDRQQELTLTGTLDATKQTDTLPDYQYTLGKDELRVVRLGAAWTGPVLGESQLNVASTVSKGSNRFGARTQADAEASGIAFSRLGANPSFLKVETNLTLQVPVSQSVNAITSARLQKSLSGVLPGAELFSLEGESALSTFTSGSISDDSGWTLRQEFVRPTSINLGADTLALAPYAFAAAGKTASKLASGTARGFSTAYGLGLRSSRGAFSLALQYGRRTSKPDNLNANQLFMKAQVQF